MESKNIILLVFLSFLFVTSGCTATQNIEKMIGLGGGGDEKAAGSGFFEIEKIDVTPNNITSGESSRVELSLRNLNKGKITVPVGYKGKKILTNYCEDIFRIERFSIEKDGRRLNRKEIVLDKEGEVTFEWEIASREIPQEVECNLGFRVSALKTTGAFRQIEFKKSEDLEGSDLEHGSFGKGPLSVSIEASEKGSYTLGKKVDIDILLRNGGKGEVSIKDKDTEIEHPKLEGSCEGVAQQVIPSGEKFSLNCDLEKNKIEHLSQIFEIYFETQYKYTLERTKKLRAVP